MNFLSRKKVYAFSLAFTVFYLALGQQEFLLYGETVKETGFLTFIFVIVAALIMPGEKSAPPLLVWLYVIIAAFSIFYVVNTSDSLHGIVIRTQWLLLVIAAVLVLSTINDQKSLKFVLESIAIGYVWFAVALVVIIFTMGDEIIFRNRLMLGGINPNQSATVAIAGAPFLLYLAINNRGLWRYFYAGLSLFLVLVGLLASRQVFLGTILALGLFYLGMARGWRIKVLWKLILVMVLAIVMFFIGIWLADTLWHEQFLIARAFDLDPRERWVNITAPYLSVINERIFFGIFGQTGLQWQEDPTIGYHPHNAYVAWWYLGGASLGIPILFLVIATLWKSFRLFLGKNSFPRSDGDMARSLIIGVSVSGYLVATVTARIYYPTFELAFVHMFCGMLILASSKQKKARALGAIHR